MSRVPVFGDKSSIAAVKKYTRAELRDSLDVVAVKSRGAAALERDEAAIRAMIAARDVAPVVAVTRKRRVRRARVNTIAPSNYTGGFRVVYFGVDTYAVNVLSEVREDFLTLLDWAQEEAKENPGVPALCPLPPFLGASLQVSDHGGGTFRFLASNGDVTVKVRKAGHASAMAPAQVWLSAACLHRLGWRRAMEEMAAWIKLWAPGGMIQPTAFHPCADTQGWQPTFEDFAGGIEQRAFVCPVARPHLIPYEAGHIGYLRFGTGGKAGSRSGSAPIQLAIYDKSEEIRQSDKGWFVPLWAQSPAYRDDEIVTRIEPRFTREYLASRGIETQDHLIAAMGSLFREALEWCRYCVPDENESNRSRWKVRDEWGVLAGLEWGEVSEAPLSRIDQARPKLERTLAAIGGHYVTLQAMLVDALDVDLRQLAEITVPAILKRWEARKEDYAVKVQSRVLRLGGIALA